MKRNRDQGKARSLMVVLLLATSAIAQAQATVSIRLTGTCIDSEDGDISTTLDWTSDIDGILGTGADFSVDMTEGVHTITATCTDSKGESVAPSVVHTVDENAAPVVMIIAPADGGCSGSGCP